jgi:putative endonuclease
MPHANTWSCYMLRCGDGSLYIGITNRLEERIKMHNAGKGAAYTRSHLPVTLVWSKRMSSATAARKQEAIMKRWPRAKKLELLNRI